MLPDRLQDVRRWYVIFVFALFEAASRRSRFREHGRHTHLLMVAVAGGLVNRSRTDAGNCRSRRAGCEIFRMQPTRLLAQLNNAVAQHRVFAGEQFFPQLITAVDDVALLYGEMVL